MASTLILLRKLPVHIYSTFIMFRWGDAWKRNQLEDPGVDGRIILKWIFRKWDGGMDRADVAHDSDRWRAVVNPVMNLRVI